jgi:hypothetical protein
MSDAATQHRPETLPFTLFLAPKDCLSRLFKQTRTLNFQVFWMIGRLLLADPTTIVKCVKDHFRDLRPLVEEITKTQNGDTCKFLHTLAVSDPDVLPKSHGLILIHPHFKKFPVATVFDFMIACLDMKILKNDQFPKGMLPLQCV